MCVIPGRPYQTRHEQNIQQNPTTTYSGIVSHQTDTQKSYLLDIIASDSLYASNVTAKATVTKQSDSWYRWYTFLKQSVITEEFLGGSDNSRGQYLWQHSLPSCDGTSSLQPGNKYSSTELSSSLYSMYLRPSGRTFAATRP